MLNEAIDFYINLALKEDLGSGDHTSLACIPKDATGKAVLVAKEAGILSGVEVAERVYSLLDPKLKFTALKKDGEHFEIGDKLWEVEGSSISILSAERLSLNFVQRMSGIATYTAYLNSLISGCKSILLDTRKTTPNNRVFEKMAVKHGGGQNHRFGLFDMILIKDNHIDFCGGIKNALLAVKKYLETCSKELDVEIEVRSEAELEEVLGLYEGAAASAAGLAQGVAAASGGAGSGQSGDVGSAQTGSDRLPKLRRIMLDNHSPSQMKKAVERINGKFETEASGGINESNLRDYALSGVDFISIGALTHKIKSLDLSLKAV